MENVITGTRWNAQELVEQVGAFETFTPDLNLHVAYYFPKPDMTMLVVRLRAKSRCGGWAGLRDEASPHKRVAKR